VREFRDADGVEWVAFFTARSVARDQHLPEEYREGWLAFESAAGEKRRLAPVPEDWESISGEELAAVCASATPQEETLALAREAARATVSLRRKLRADRDRKVREGTESRPRSDDEHA
jgi:hypothetical protein